MWKCSSRFSRTLCAVQLTCRPYFWGARLHAVTNEHVEMRVLPALLQSATALLSSAVPTGARCEDWARDRVVVIRRSLCSSALSETMPGVHQLHGMSQLATQAQVPNFWETNPRPSFLFFFLFLTFIMWHTSIRGKQLRDMQILISSCLWFKPRGIYICLRPCSFGDSLWKIFKCTSLKHICISSLTTALPTPQCKLKNIKKIKPPSLFSIPFSFICCARQ